jgi:hypothetical protein
MTPEDRTSRSPAVRFARWARGLTAYAGAIAPAAQELLWGREQKAEVERPRDVEAAPATKRGTR